MIRPVVVVSGPDARPARTDHPLLREFDRLLAQAWTDDAARRAFSSNEHGAFDRHPDPRAGFIQSNEALQPSPTALVCPTRACPSRLKTRWRCAINTKHHAASRRAARAENSPIPGRRILRHGVAARKVI
jgi:hypothetical protein